MILIVDDEYILREIYANTLYDLDSTQTAEDGLQAWQYRKMR